MRGNRPVSSHGSDQLISSPDNDVVRRLRRLARRREPGLVLLEGPRVLAEAKAAGLEFELLVVREGDKLPRSEEHTSELQSHSDLVCRLLLEKKKRKKQTEHTH